MVTVSTEKKAMNHLDALEYQSVYILREAYREFKQLVMLWSIGKDSTVLLWLARKAFFGHVPLPLMHIDTGCKIPVMIDYRDQLARDWKLNMIVGKNVQAIKAKQTFLDGNVSRLQCCATLKSEALKHTLSGEWPRWVLNHTTGEYDIQEHGEPYTGVIVGARADEEGSRSKERYFSPRDHHSDWNVSDQPPELWNYFKTDFAPGAHIRIHPLLDWTELNIWEYIDRENIPIVDLYFHQDNGKRFRSLGCYPCTMPVNSTAKNVKEIIEELRRGKFSNIAERSGREQDKEDGNGLETLRRDGYM
jgi:sulfate adenylyltransferase subunit 2